MAFTKFESDLMRLHWIAYRLEALHNGFYQIKDEYADANWFRATIREYIIIQLHSFIKIRKSIIQNSQAKIIDECIKPLWEPILKHEEAIKQLRDSYLAHMQEKKKTFEKYIGDIVLDYQFPTKWGDNLFFAGCVWYYYEYLRCNFKQEWLSAIKKYRLYRPVLVGFGSIDEKNVYSFLQSVEQQVITNLKNNNFNIDKIDDRQALRDLRF